MLLCIFFVLTSALKVNIFQFVNSSDAKQRISEVASKETQNMAKIVFRDNGNPIHLIRIPYKGCANCSHYRTVCRIWPLLSLRYHWHEFDISLGS